MMNQNYAKYVFKHEQVSNNNKTALGNNLIGTISEELSELTNLTRFILRFNEELTHVIPKSFEYLSNLSILSLSYNGLHDNLDMTFLTNLTKLTILDLSNNNFQKHIPPFFGTFAKIGKFVLFLKTIYFSFISACGFFGPFYVKSYIIYLCVFVGCL